MPREHYALATAFAVLAALVPVEGRGQLVTSVDAGVASVDYHSSPREGALTLTPVLRLDRGRSAVSASGTLSMFQDGDWGAQGMIAGSAFTPEVGAFRGELSVSANAVAFRDFSDSWQYLAQARAHLHDERRGMWIGGGAGHTRVRATWTPMAIVDGGVWANLAGASIRGALSHSAYLLDEALFGSSPSVIDRRLDFTDLAGSVAVSRGSLGLDLSGGLRADATSRLGRWGAASGSVWLSNRIAAVASIGNYLPDPMQRLPGGNYAMLTMRLASRSSNSAAGGEAEARAIDFVVVREGDGSSRVIRIHAPRARGVELMGDFTDWRPVALTRESGEIWRLELSIAPGTYRLSIRVDGREWRAPPGIPSLVDEFDSQVGVIVLR